MGESEQKRNDRNLNALILAASDVLIDEDVEYLNSIDVSKTEISPKLDRRIRRRIHRESRKESIAKLMSYTRRVAAVFLVICSISFVLCMSVTAVRTEIVNTVMAWYNKYVSVFYVTEQTPPSVIEEYREPMLQLAGTERQVFDRNETNYIVLYFIDDNRFMWYQQMIITHNSADIDNENCLITGIKVGEYDAQLFEYEDGMKKITWHDNEYAYIISLDPSDFTTDVLIDVAESIK